MLVFLKERIHCEAEFKWFSWPAKQSDLGLDVFVNISEVDAIFMDVG